MADATKQARHTPGPWRTPGPTETKMAPIHTDENVVAHVGAKTLDYEENDANARLIAAAPELLEACEKALTALEHVNERMGISEDEVDLPNTIRAAITKAKGDTDG